MSEFSPQTMSEKRCLCGARAEEIINTEEKKRVGWYCSSCQRFEKAILRERMWRSNNEYR